MNEQEETLFPQERPEGNLRTIGLVMLTSDGSTANLVGAAPSPQLIESMRVYGQQQPIVVVEERDGFYTVVSGRRRIKAADELGWEGMRAWVYPRREIPSPDVMMLNDHATRAPNEAADIAAVETLLGKGRDERQIAEASGLSVQTVRKYIRLAENLSPELMQLFQCGEVSKSVAEKSARLPAPLQRELMTVYRENGKITGPDVYEVSRARREEAVAELPLDLPEPASNTSVSSESGEEEVVDSTEANAEASAEANADREKELLTDFLHYLTDVLGISVADEARLVEHYRERRGG